MLSVSYNPSLGFYPKPRIRVGSYFMYVFCCLYWVIFFTHIDSTLLRRWVVLLSAIFCIPYRLGLSSTSSMCFCLLIISRAPTITGLVVVLSCYIFKIFISRSFYLLILLLHSWLICRYLLALTYQLVNMFFFYSL